RVVFSFRFGLRCLFFRRLFRCLGFGGLAAALATTLGGALVDQRDRLGKRERILVLVARHRRVHAAGRDIGTVAAILERDRAKAPVIAKRLAGIGAEAAAARALGDLLGDERDRAVQADVKDFVAGLEARIGLVMANERTKAPDAGRDRQAGLRVLADFTGQR